MYTLDAQGCVDTVNVRQRGTIIVSTDDDSGSQVLVPRSNFSCDGRITGYQISLTSVRSSRGSYPIVQVWRPTSSTTYTRVDNACSLSANDITLMENGMDGRNEDQYYLGNVSCTENSRIEFQSGDVIGYYHSDRLLYRLQSIQTIGYISYLLITEEFDNPADQFNINDRQVVIINDRQPLIQVMFGKNNNFTV